MQPARHRVAAAAELATRVQHGEDDLDGRLLLHGVHVHGDATAVVGDTHAAVSAQHHVDGVAEAGQRLVDGVVDHLVDKMVQSAFTGRADVHAGAFTNRFQTFENLDIAGVV